VLTFNTGQDNLFIGYLSGDVTKFLNGVERDYNPPAYTASSNDAIWTITTLADVLWRSLVSPRERQSVPKFYPGLARGPGRPTSIRCAAGVLRSRLVSPTREAATPLAETPQNRSVTLCESL
jgi:hypothetical protein